MNPIQTTLIALRAIGSNKLRALLTTLGIVIGVAAVIAMMAIGAGARSQVEQAFAAMGTNLLMILPGSTSSGGIQGGSGTMQTITWDDLDAIRSDVDTVQAAAPVLRATMTLIADDQNWTTSVTGTSPEYFEIRNWPMEDGAAFVQADLDGGAKVAVLGQTVVDRLFGPNARPIGRTIRMGNMPYRVVGIASKKGQSSTGQDYDDSAFIPVTTFAQKVQGGLGKFLRGTIMVQATSAANTSRAQSEIGGLLRDRHHLPDGRDDDFSIRDLSEIAGAQEEGTKTMTILLASVAAISLVVGGIGIMNIMLVGVTERTREIGLRMALGATPFDVLAQFLAEALSLSMAGGLIGVVGGIGISRWIAEKFHWPTLVQPNVIGVAVGFSAVVGIVFGLYPARKASQLDPIEALRFE